MYQIFSTLCATLRHIEVKADCHGNPEITLGDHKAPALVVDAQK